MGRLSESSLLVAHHQISLLVGSQQATSMVMLILRMLWVPVGDNPRCGLILHCLLVMPLLALGNEHMPPPHTTHTEGMNREDGPSGALCF